jgi:hypothetical protein
LYIRFKGRDRDYFPAISTKQTTDDATIEVAFKWLREGKVSDTMFYEKVFVIQVSDTMSYEKTLAD